MDKSYKKFQDNYDSINWDTSKGGSSGEVIPIISPQSFQSCLQQIAAEKREALQSGVTSISSAITLLYEVEGLLAWSTKCPAKDRRDVWEVVEERLHQIQKEILNLSANINIIQKP